MFDEIIRASYSPSSNIQGGVPDGNWVFLLPNLELGQVLCVGQPSLNTLKTLTSLARNVLQVETLAGLEPGFDLIYLASATIKPDWQALRRLLTPEGSIYYEDRGDSTPKTPDHLNLKQSLWLTPTFGRMQTAVPLADRQTIHYFQENRLYSPTISHQTFEDLRQWWRKRQGKAPSHGTIAPESPVTSSRSKGLKKRLRTILRKTRNAIVALAPGLENAITRNRLTRPLLSRRGVLLAPADTTPYSSSLPDYLRRTALDNQVDLSGYRWGYAARGRYRSQKLLFVLFEPGAGQPAYVVKMVRDAVFNARLEREHQGLLRLQHDQVMPAGTLPQTAFFGYHHNLAVVGETVIAGDSFEARSQFDADCQYAQAAIHWLIDLSALTVIHSAPVDNIADDFQNLVDRFTEIYGPSPAQQQFLNDQVACVRRQPPSLVFQHGDPGSWNLLVTAEDQVAFLDWENATPHGVPLWDVIYFLRSYCIAAGQKTGDYGNLAAFEHFFLQESAISPLIVNAVQWYCQQVPLSPELVEPLFYLCWLFWAVKQAAMVEPARLGTAHYWQLLKLCIDRRDSPTLARIFSL